MIEVREWRQERENMVQRQIIGRGIKDPRVVEAMRVVPRHFFIEKTYSHQAYGDYPLPIGQEQTISQPYMVAKMTELLELNPGDHVLEIGTGSGYQTAVLAYLCKIVYTIERISELGRNAKERLLALGFGNISYMIGDGSLGWPECAPFDAIMITAGAPEIPDPLIKQLAEKGRMVIPVGDRSYQVLNFVRKQKGRIFREQFFECTFVPLVGKESWQNGA
jgi:protein-L-isoaspartate(D-aspartate) O-methyltransferase